MEEFLGGLRRLGYNRDPLPKSRPEPGDLLLMWNRRSVDATYAKNFEHAGGTVIVAENGYINGRDGEKRYALALGHHNGAGRWRVGGPERFEALRLELAPWRMSGDHVLVLPQRGIGEGGVAMPMQWGHRMFVDLQRTLARPVRLRRHPGDLKKSEPYVDLQNAHCAVTWGSGAGIKALAVGIPVFHAFPRWIGAGAASPLDGADLERPFMDDDARLTMFRRLAWAQFTMREIVSGDAFAWLLQR